MKIVWCKFMQRLWKVNEIIYLNQKKQCNDEFPAVFVSNFSIFHAQFYIGEYNEHLDGGVNTSTIKIWKRALQCATKDSI